MHHPKQGLDAPAAGRLSVERAQALTAAAGCVRLEVEHIPLGRATGRVLARVPGGLEASPRSVAPGMVVAASHVPRLALSGSPTLQVFRRLRVGVLTTGLVPNGREPGHDHGLNVAGPLLTSMLESMGAQPFQASHLGPCGRSFGSSLDMLLTECSVVLVAGCMGNGKHEAIRQALLARGAEVGVVRPWMRPAASLSLARIGSKTVVALPDDLSAGFLAFLLFVSPLIRRLQGRTELYPAAFSAWAIEGQAPHRQLDEFLFARELGKKSGSWDLELIGPKTPAHLALGTATGVARSGATACPDGGWVYYPFSSWLA